MKRITTALTLIFCLIIPIFTQSCETIQTNETYAQTEQYTQTTIQTTGTPADAPLQTDESETANVTDTEPSTDNGSQTEAAGVTEEKPNTSGTQQTDAAAVTDGKPSTVDDGELKVYFLDVGQADCAFVTCDGVNMIIDGGNKGDSSLVYSFLKRNNVSHLDYVVCTHAHEDHVGGLPGALSLCTVGSVFSPVTDYDSEAFEDFKKSVSKRGASITVPACGDAFALGSARVRIIAPLCQYDDTNNTSIVLKITHGSISFLFTGDAEYDSEKDMTEKYDNLSSTVLKVGHHGSSTSSSYSFLREVMPEYAVISVGKDNSYGHPDDNTVSRLTDCGAQIFRTDKQGDILCISDGASVAFSVSKIITEPVTEEEQEQISYIGNKNSLKLHLPSCSSLPNEENRIYFTSKESALSLGYEPCKRCMG